MRETFYLIDFENVHNDGIANIEDLSKGDHVHIFSTENALNIKTEVFWRKDDMVTPHLVPAGPQSLDMHLVSYLGYLLGRKGKQCTYKIISKDKGYDNIIRFWKEEGYNIIRESEIKSRKVNPQNKITTQTTNTRNSLYAQTGNNRISAGMNYEFSGADRSKLNEFMQHELVALGYDSNTSNWICKIVVAHCNDDRMLSGIHNDIKKEWSDCSEVYEDVKSILEKFATTKSRVAKRERESKVRSFFGKHLKSYVDCKEEIIAIILNAETKQQVNNELLKLYKDGEIVTHIYETVRPLIEDLPGK